MLYIFLIMFYEKRKAELLLSAVAIYFALINFHTVFIINHVDDIPARWIVQVRGRVISKGGGRGVKTRQWKSGDANNARGSYFYRANPFNRPPALRWRRSIDKFVAIRPHHLSPSSSESDRLTLLSSATRRAVIYRGKCNLQSRVVAQQKTELH